MSNSIIDNPLHYLPEELEIQIFHMIHEMKFFNVLKEMNQIYVRTTRKKLGILNAIFNDENIEFNYTPNTVFFKPNSTYRHSCNFSIVADYSR